MICPKCNSSNTIKRGREIKCKDCGKFSAIPVDLETSEIVSEKDSLRIICTSKRLKTEQDVISEFKIDTSVWQLDKFRVKTSEGYRKDKSVSWEVEDGKVLHGNVKDTGNMLVVQMYHLEALFSRKVQEVRTGLAIRQMIEDSKKKVAISRPKIKSVPSGLTLEMDFPDLHFGLLSWAEEAGYDYDIKIAKEVITTTLEKLLSHTRNYKIANIILPIGNDFFNADGVDEETSHGTPQDQDTRWAKTFRAGRQLAVELIEKLSHVAPVKVLVIPGNHDETLSFYLGDSLEAWFHKDKNVIVDNRACKRKYYAFDRNLIGFTHGYWEKIDRLPMIMPIEQPQAWAASTNREWHLGHIHQKKDLIFKTEEGNGITIRYLRALCAASAWIFNKGFVGTSRSAEAFLWHPKEGLIAQFNAIV